jgi:hypothetical protein
MLHNVDGFLASGMASFYSNGRPSRSCKPAQAAAITWAFSARRAPARSLARCPFSDDAANAALTSASKAEGLTFLPVGHSSTDVERNSRCQECHLPCISRHWMWRVA